MNVKLEIKEQEKRVKSAWNKLEVLTVLQYIATPVAQQILFFCSPSQKMFPSFYFCTSVLHLFNLIQIISMYSHMLSDLLLSSVVAAITCEILAAFRMLSALQYSKLCSL